jgi:hypothetical protein
MDNHERREFNEALLDADSFEDLPGKWRAAILNAEAAPPTAPGPQGRLAQRESQPWPPHHRAGWRDLYNAATSGCTQ